MDVFSMSEQMGDIDPWVSFFKTPVFCTHVVTWRPWWTKWITHRYGLHVLL